MEGDEAIVSAEQTKANWPIIEAMFKNARTPTKRNKPVDLPAFRDGGMFESPYFQRGMYLFGIKKKKREAEQAAKDAEAEAQRAQAEADAMGGGYGFDGGDYGGIDTGGVGINGDASAAQAANEQAQKQGETQLKLLQDIVDGLDDVGLAIEQMGTAVNATLSEVKSAIDGVRGSRPGKRREPRAGWRARCTPCQRQRDPGGDHAADQ